MVSHLGPPTAPSKIASAVLAAANVCSGKGTPVASMAQPPSSSFDHVKSKLNRWLTFAKTLVASAIISGPIPSPAKITIC